MGRGKLPLKLIEKERARRITCMKRKKGLVKKAYELSTLCDVRVCLIIYDSADSDVKTWPEQPHQVERIVADYLAYKAKNPSAKRDLNISDFFNDRIKKLKQQNDKLLRQTDHVNHSDQAFPVWDSRIDDFSEDELFDLLASLDAKINAVNKLKADRAAIQCVTPHGTSSSSCKAWLDHPSLSNDAAFLNGQFAGFDQATPFDLNACCHEYNKISVIGGSNNVNMPYYTNLLEGGGLLPDWYGSAFTVPNGPAAMTANNDEVFANNLMLQPCVNLAEPLPLPLQGGLPADRGQLQYYPPTVSMEPLYVANMRVMIGGGPSVDSDHKFLASTSSQEDVRNLFYDNMDMGFGKAPAV